MTSIWGCHRLPPTLQDSVYSLLSDPVKPLQLSDRYDQVWLLANPRAGARSAVEGVEAFERQIGRAGLRTERFTDPESLAQAVGQRDLSRLRAVVAAGGDGTANLVASLLPPEVPFVPLPLGTENLLAKYLCYVDGPSQVADAVLSGRVERFDAGQCNDRLFLLMVGVGFDAEVVRRLHAARTGHIRHLSYAAPIMRTIWEYPYPQLRVRYTTGVDGAGPWGEADGSWVFVINLPRYARGLSFVPEASGQDGYLDLCVFKSGSLWAGLYYLANVVMGHHQQLDDCLIERVSRVHIEMADSQLEPVAYQYDGDPGGQLPVQIQVLPQRCSIIVPPDWNDGGGDDERDRETDA